MAGPVTFLIPSVIKGLTRKRVTRLSFNNRIGMKPISLCKALGGFEQKQEKNGPSHDWRALVGLYCTDVIRAWSSNVSFDFDLWRSLVDW
jgi:hypothetical protein